MFYSAHSRSDIYIDPMNALSSHCFFLLLSIPVGSSTVEMLSQVDVFREGGLSVGVDLNCLDYVGGIIKILFLISFRIKGEKIALVMADTGINAALYATCFSSGYFNRIIFFRSQFRFL